MPSKDYYESHKEEYKAWREANKERKSQYDKAYREANRERYAQQYQEKRAYRIQQNKAWREANKEHNTHYRRTRLYGITRHEWNLLYDHQNGLCAICGIALTGRIATDHCHTTGKIRGLLCDPCNRGLGCFNDNPDVLERAIQYIREQSEDSDPHNSLVRLVK